VALAASLLFVVAPAAAQHQPPDPVGDGRPAAAGQAAQTGRHLDAQARRQVHGQSGHKHRCPGDCAKHGAGQGDEHGAGQGAKHAAGHGDEHGAGHGAEHGAHHCPGHGPDDPPGHINLFHGFFGLTTDKPSEVGWLRRYDNPDDPCAKEQPPLLAAVANFLILALLIYRFGRKPISQALRNRKETIMKEIDEAQAIKDKAQRRLDDYEGELDHLDDKLVSLREQYAKEAKLEDKRTREELAAARDRMMADADFRLAQESKSARDELSRRALSDALSAAEELLGKAVSPRDRDRLAEQYLDYIGAALQDDDDARAREAKP